MHFHANYVSTSAFGDGVYWSLSLKLLFLAGTGTPE